MLRTLHGKLAAVILGLLCFTALLYIPLTLFTARRYFQEADQKHNWDLAFHLAEYLTSKHILHDDKSSLERSRAEIKQLMVLNPNIDIYLLDKQGAVRIFSGDPEAVKRHVVAVEPLKRFLGGTHVLPVLGDCPRGPGLQKIFSVAALPIKGRSEPRQFEGYVYIILEGHGLTSTAQQLQRSYILRFSVAVMVGSLLFVLLMGLYVLSSLTRRLRKLTKDVKAFRQVDDTEPVATSGGKSFFSAHGDEIDLLNTVFNQMAVRIERQVQELNEADTSRREMVSNVSHDLRTPLAALQGYLETLAMKEGQLTTQEQQNYLAIASSHAERLAKLIAELFELAKLESHDVQIHAEPFSPGELVQDVAMKFRLVAENRGLRLETSFSPDLPYVCADIALIERVLENLLDNAFRYTPYGGVITLALALHGQEVQIQVQDTGRGIREEDLPHIFERYYRVERQGDTPGSAGLGLAITKRMLELNGSTIAARSTPDKGTTFTFSLPVSRI